MAYAKGVLTEATAELAAFYERIAVLVGRPMAHEVLLPVSVPAFTGLNGTTSAAGASPEDVSAVVQVGAALGAAAPGGESEAGRYGPGPDHHHPPSSATALGPRAPAGPQLACAGHQ